MNRSHRRQWPGVTLKRYLGHHSKYHSGHILDIKWGHWEAFLLLLLSFDLTSRRSKIQRWGFPALTLRPHAVASYDTCGGPGGSRFFTLVGVGDPQRWHEASHPRPKPRYNTPHPPLVPPHCHSAPPPQGAVYMVYLGPSIWAKGCILMTVCVFYLTWHNYPSLV